MLNSSPTPDEVGSRPDDGLRPRRLDDYIGQAELKQVLGIAVKATLARGNAVVWLCRLGQTPSALNCCCSSKYPIMQMTVFDAEWYVWVDRESTKGCNAGSCF